MITEYIFVPEICGEYSVEGPGAECEDDPLSRALLSILPKNTLKLYVIYCKDYKKTPCTY